MKQKLLIFLALAVVIAVLVGLNVASYTQRPEESDTEHTPNRSSFNPGATGSQAYFSLLAESGIKAVRWQESPSALLEYSKNAPTHFVVIGELRREFTPAEVSDLLSWVFSGGQLVVIDREPPESLFATRGTLQVRPVAGSSANIFSIDPGDKIAMTANVAAATPSQPSVFTTGVNAVQPSIFAAGGAIRSKDRDEQGGKVESDSSFGVPTSDQGEAPPPAASDYSEPEVNSAPVVHVTSQAKNLVVDYQHGSGRVVFVSDPYIVSNGGITLADNAQLAVNLVRSEGGTVAFDEYHHGYGTNNNRFLEFFGGTPAVAIFFQSLLLVGLMLYSQARRFARPVDEPEPGRLSKLEYVSAMAALQKRSRAYDLAVENIYKDFKRRAARLLGLDLSKVTTTELAASLSHRVSMSRSEIEATLDDCEEIMFGERAKEARVVELIAAIRTLEGELGVRRRTERR